MSDWYSIQYGNGVYGAMAKLMPGDRLVVNAAQNLTTPIKMSVPCTELLILKALQGGDDVAVESLADYITVKSRGAGIIMDSCLSAIMVTSAAHFCVVDGVRIQNYNTKNATGHAGIFGYQCSDLTVRNCRIMTGNGNGIRTDGVNGAFIWNNRVSRTAGASSEGITLGASHIKCAWNVVDRAYETGILVFAGPYTDIDILHNTVSNSAQDPKASHPGIGVSLNGSSICGLTVGFNTCYDDQLDATGKPAPTQSHIMAIFGPGKIVHGRVSGNVGWGNQFSDPFTLVAAPDLSTDCTVG